MGAASALAQRVLAVAPANPVANLVSWSTTSPRATPPPPSRGCRRCQTGAVFRIAAPLAARLDQCRAQPAAAGQPMRCAASGRSRRSPASFAYHLALIAEVSGQNEEAERQYRRALEVEGPSVRTVEAAAAFFTRIGKPEEGRAVLESLPAQRWRSALRPQVPTPRTGAAEALMNLATALRQQENNLLDAILFGQLARALAPRTTRRRSWLPIASSPASGAPRRTSSMPASRRRTPLGWVARLRMAENLDLANDTAAAIATLSTMADERPERIRRADHARAHPAPARALCRRRGRVRPCHPAPAGGRAVAVGALLSSAAFPTSARSNGRRRRRISAARLELQPDQPDVLNISPIPGSTRASRDFEEAEPC
jgi:hypothetical protein